MRGRECAPPVTVTLHSEESTPKTVQLAQTVVQAQPVRVSVAPAAMEAVCTATVSTPLLPVVPEGGVSVSDEAVVQLTPTPAAGEPFCVAVSATLHCPPAPAAR